MTTIRYVLLLSVLVQGLNAADAAADEGKRIYERPGMCITCHQASGAGIPGAFPPLTNSPWVTGDQAAHIILGGVRGPITVGAKQYASLMPGLAGQLTDAQVAAVLTYVRSSFGNQAPAVTTEQVALARAEVKLHGATPYTVAELTGQGAQP